MPVIGVPMPQERAFSQRHPAPKFSLIVSSEDTANDCFGQAPHEASILDITDEAAPWPIATLNVPPRPGRFLRERRALWCPRRHGSNLSALLREDHRRVLVQCRCALVDIRDPENPRPITYYIQAPNQNTVASCATINGEIDLSECDHERLCGIRRSRLYLRCRPGFGRHDPVAHRRRVEGRRAGAGCSGTRPVAVFQPKQRALEVTMKSSWSVPALAVALSALAIFPARAGSDIANIVPGRSTKPTCGCCSVRHDIVQYDGWHGDGR